MAKSAVSSKLGTDVNIEQNKKHQLRYESIKNADYRNKTWKNSK